MMTTASLLAAARRGLASAAGDGVLGKVCRLIPGGALVQLRDAAEKVSVKHPEPPAKRLAIHDDVELTRLGAGDDAGWAAKIIDDGTGGGAGRTRTGLPHLDERGGGGGGGGLLSDLHPWRKKKKGKGAGFWAQLPGGRY